MSALKSRSYPEAPARLSLCSFSPWSTVFVSQSDSSASAFPAPVMWDLSVFWFPIVCSLLPHFHSLWSLAGFGSICATHHCITLFFSLTCILSSFILWEALIRKKKSFSFSPWRPREPGRQRELTLEEVGALGARGKVGTNLTAWTKPTLKQLSRCRAGGEGWKAELSNSELCGEEMQESRWKSYSTRSLSFRCFPLLLVATRPRFPHILLINLSVTHLQCASHERFVWVCVHSACLPFICHAYSRALHTTDNNTRCLLVREKGFDHELFQSLQNSFLFFIFGTFGSGKVFSALEESSYK